MSNLVQEKTLNSVTTVVTLTGAPGPITVSGTFDGATVTQTMPGDVVPIETFTTQGFFFFNGQDIEFTKTGGAGSENISIKWFRNKTPY